MSVRRAQAEIDSREFSEWIAYHGLEPFGEERADLRAGIVAATVANVHRGRGQRALKPADFMPKPPQRPRRQSLEDMRRTMEAFARTHNARVA